MNIKNYLENICKHSYKTSIIHHIEKPIIANGFEYEMHKFYNNEMIIRINIDYNKKNEHGETNKIIKELNEILKKEKDIDWIEHWGEELMKDYDEIIIWWNQ